MTIVSARLSAARIQRRGSRRRCATVGERPSGTASRRTTPSRPCTWTIISARAAGGCVPGAMIEKLPSEVSRRWPRWNANRKLGRPSPLRRWTRLHAAGRRIRLGTVAVDNAFHYLWGGGYVIDAASKGYIAYTCCTAALAEVVPFGGKFPTLGTNPHSWAFPTTEAVGFPICIDWATSIVAMGRVQQFAREGKTPSARLRRRQGRQRNDRSGQGRRAAAVRAAQRIRPVADRRDCWRLHRRIAADAAQPMGRRPAGREAHAGVLLPVHPARRASTAASSPAAERRGKTSRR